MLNAHQQQILRLLIASQGMSRTLIAEQMKLSKAAITTQVKEMLNAGLLEESIPESNGQGRPSVLLKMRADSAYFLGASLLGERVVLVLIDMHGHTLAATEMALHLAPAQLVAAIAAAIPALIAQKSISLDQVIGLGVTLSGFIDEHQAVCVQSALLGWKNVPLAEMLKQQTGLDVSLENDAKALAVSEKMFGVAKKARNFTLISHGDGIGSAHFFQGQLHRGAHGGAGEIAHCTIEPGGRPCRCGKRGCLDTLASLTAIRESTRDKALESESIGELEALAVKGNSAAIAILHQAGHALGLSIANIIQMNDPELIVIAHQPDAFDGLLKTVVMQAIDSNVLPAMMGKTPIANIAINEQSWARAAASVAAYRFIIHLPD
ncbi:MULTISPECIES: ROK family transcriptional regulator [Pantoea]|uniref:Sugar kinase of the NBD/HSP70 family, may contain an N-terminal HTH domain n=1 Tax=Candidatus Pantoea floridensis TaxID=1938870 RepID=A0A286DNJ2_9GAMM|nr:ROK family transcriptional regulator [Pantoea floridensis]PIF15169.1 putative NBD/HSP70 family sugar kinase [Enterobacteriaceae bacterium JKS000233]SOD60196.1 Sugar kinase of the NBD/HSP70 family, may contain an N-terminal HTH domain [Pantoea floridensis]